MSDTEGYNGWSNYPTWAVNLWLSNDEGLYNATLDVVKSVDVDVDDGGDYSAKMVNQIADQLKSWVSEDLTPDLEASFTADLLGYALDQVDWNEIATNWIEA